MRLSLLIVMLTYCALATAQSPASAPRNGHTAATGNSSSDTGTSPSVPLAADTLYVCIYQSDSTLYQVNATTGAAKLVGSMDLDQTCTDLAFRTTTASGTELFGTSFTNLFRVDPTTGKAKLLPNAYGSGVDNINALVAEPGTGILYGAGGATPGQFISINPTSGKATVLGSFGKEFSSAGDLEFLKGKLYALVNKSTEGAATYLATISLSPGTMGKATNLLPIRLRVNGKLEVQDNVRGLANRSGVLYAAMETGQLLILDPTTGMATLKGDNSLSQAGLAISPP
jgi:hypothetical protein